MKPLRLLGLLLMIGMSVAMPAFAGQLEDGQEAWDREDYKTALKLLRPLAEQGNAEAQYNLAVAHIVGLGVPIDLVQGYKWAYLAASHSSGIQRDINIMWRDDSAALMTPVQLVEAQRWARERKPTR
jgi:hypothetical protein